MRHLLIAYSVIIDAAGASISICNLVNNQNTIFKPVSAKAAFIVRQ